MIKSILLSLFIIGIILIMIGLIRTQQTCPTEKIIYRYIPRTFDEEQNEPVYVSDIFKSMFTQPSTWNSGLIEYDTRRQESMNKYFISQM